MQNQTKNNFNGTQVNYQCDLSSQHLRKHLDGVKENRITLQSHFGSGVLKNFLGACVTAGSRATWPWLFHYRALASTVPCSDCLLHITEDCKKITSILSIHINLSTPRQDPKAWLPHSVFHVCSSASRVVQTHCTNTRALPAVSTKSLKHPNSWSWTSTHPEEQVGWHLLPKPNEGWGLVMQADSYLHLS